MNIKHEAHIYHPPPSPVSLVRAISPAPHPFSPRYVDPHSLSATSEAGPVALTISRSDISNGMHVFALLPALSLRAGSLNVAYAGEEGVDMGGVFRDFMDVASRYFVDPSSRLLEPGPDAGLLPVQIDTDALEKHDDDGNGTGKGGGAGVGGRKGGGELERNGGGAGGGGGGRGVDDPVSSIPIVSVLASQHCAENAERAKQLFAFGRLLALAVVRRTPLNVCLSRCVYKLIAGEKITMEDVMRIDPSFAKHRVQSVLKPGGVAEMEAALMEELYFVSCVPGEEETPLVEGGETIRVTERNKAEYVTRLAEHFLLGRCRNGLAMVVAGFHDVIPKSVLRGTGNEGDQKKEGNGGSSSGNSSSHGSEASLSNCPGGHGLTPCLADDVRCDACGADIPDNASIHSCKECDYDLCDGCGAVSTVIRGIDLELIVTGLPSVSVDDWKAHTRWAPVGIDKAEAHEQLRRWFWEVRCTPTVKCQVMHEFIQFITTRRAHRALPRCTRQSQH